jgi:hypothetical protein
LLAAVVSKPALLKLVALLALVNEILGSRALELIKFKLSVGEMLFLVAEYSTGDWGTLVETVLPETVVLMVELPTISGMGYTSCNTIL